MLSEQITLVQQIVDYRFFKNMFCVYKGVPSYACRYY